MAVLGWDWRTLPGRWLQGGKSQTFHLQAQIHSPPLALVWLYNGHKFPYEFKSCSPSGKIFLQLSYRVKEKIKPLGLVYKPWPLCEYNPHVHKGRNSAWFFTPLNQWAPFHWFQPKLLPDLTEWQETLKHLPAGSISSLFIWQLLQSKITTGNSCLPIWFYVFSSMVPLSAPMYNMLLNDKVMGKHCNFKSN